MKKTIIFGSLLCLIACEPAAEPEPPIIRPVRLAVVKDTSGEPVTRTFSGISRASEESKLSFRVGGSLSKLNVKLGDRIESGQEIARLDASDLKLQAQQAADSVAQTTANRRSAQAEFDRVRKLYENSTASRSQYDQARNNLDQAKASMRSASKQVTLARKQVGYTKLVAPTAGVVSKVMAQAGENVGVGQTVITLASGETPEVVVNVPGTFIAQIKVGDAVKVRFKDIPNKTFDAVVREISVSPGDKQTTFPVIAALETRDPGIRLGMTVGVEFENQDEAVVAGLHVPNTAVAEDSAGQYVFTFKDAGDGMGTVHKQRVTVTEQISDRGIQVTEGLKPGDRVVTAGVSRIAEGQRVRLLSGGE